MKICETCGRPILSLEELEAELGTPLTYLFRQYEIWKRLREQEERKHEGTADSKQWL
jgi:hypothetical protein